MKIDYLKYLIQSRADMSLVMKLRETNFETKREQEDVNSTATLQRIAIRYFSVSDQDLLDLYAVTCEQIDEVTASISLKDLAQII